MYDFYRLPRGEQIRMMATIRGRDLVTAWSRAEDDD